MRSFIEGVHTSQDKKIYYKLSEVDISSWIKVINSELGAHGYRKKFISLRLVNEKKMQDLNYNFRGISHSTNVLAFPAELEDKNEINNLLGDIAICVDVLKREAKEQHKKPQDHLAHLFIHGVLHLMGFSHENECSGNSMESTEKKILNKLGIDDPYQLEL